MYNYHAYNLGVISALPLPELETVAEAAADVTIQVGKVDWSPPPAIGFEEELRFEIATDDAYLYWSQLGKFRVRDAKEIVIDPISGVDSRMLHLPLLGTILAVLLHQRGHLVLHASAAAIDGQAVIFVGTKGQGKSTMAATLYRRGHQLLADDVVALTFEEGHPMVIPGFPQIKLYPEALEAALGDDHRLLPELVDGYEKRGRRITERFARNAMPVKGVYVLAQGPITTLTSLDAQTALLALIANSYMSRFGKHLLKGDEASSHLQQCTSLIRQVPVYRLERPNALELLPATAELVEEQVQSREIMVPSNLTGNVVKKGVHFQ